MSATAIDLEMLNELLDNQKKMDDVFLSFFDDDESFLDEPVLVSKEANEASSQYLQTSDESSFDSEDAFVVDKSQGVTRFIVPLVAMEVAVISCSIMYFS